MYKDFFHIAKELLLNNMFAFESYLDSHLKLFVSPKELSNWILKIKITFLNGFLTFSKYRPILL
jgi:hypothetical protein